MTQPTRHIQAYSLLEYTQKLNEALNEGYELKLDTNEGTCQHIGFYFEVLMYKEPSVKLAKALETTVAIPEGQSFINPVDAPVALPQKQRGRTSAK